MPPDRTPEQERLAQAVEQAGGPMAQPQMQIPTSVPIMPLPTAITLDIVPSPDGKEMVGFRIQDPGGVKVVMLTPDAAKDLGEQLKNAGVRAGLGLTIIGRN